MACDSNLPPQFESLTTDAVPIQNLNISDTENNDDNRNAEVTAHEDLPEIQEMKLQPDETSAHNQQQEIPKRNQTEGEEQQLPKEKSSKKQPRKNPQGKNI